MTELINTFLACSIGLGMMLLYQEIWGRNVIPALVMVGLALIASGFCSLILNRRIEDTREKQMEEQ